MQIRGQCHCGNLRFALDWRPEPESIAARACDCTFCMRHGNVWTSCPTGALRIEVRDRARLSNYAFGTRTAEFLVCAHCGVVPVATSRIEDRLHAVVNVNTFIGDGLPPITRSAAHFDGEDERVRLARRQRNWIGTVEFVAADA